ASKLVAQFGTVENLLDHLVDVPAKQRAAIEPLEEQVRMAKDLATIVRDAPVTLDLARAALVDFDRQRVVGLFHELGFRRMIDDIARSMGDASAVDGAGAAGQIAMFVEAVEGSDASGSDSAASNARPSATVTDVAALDEVVQAIRAAGTVALNVQTTGLAPMRAEIVGVGLAT